MVINFTFSQKLSLSVEIIITILNTLMSKNDKNKK